MPVIVEDDEIRLEKLTLGPFGTNCYIVVCQKTKQSAVIDTPAEPETILKHLEGTSPEYILLTHDHMDHLGALSGLHSSLKVPLAAHPADSAGLPVKPELTLSDGDVLTVGNLKIEVLHTPGHTPGSVCFRTGKYLLSGDTIFSGGPGKSWSAAALKQLIESLKAKVFVLPDDTEIHPGHGESTVLKKEKKEFALYSSRPHPPDLYGDIVWLTS